MNARELTLNIAVNLGRIGRWALEGRARRLDQFLRQTQGYIDQLEQAPKSARFQRTFVVFKETFRSLQNDVRLEPAWAEMMSTWADILTHRARLA